MEATELGRWQEHIMYNERLRQLGLVQAGEGNEQRRILLLSTTTTSEDPEVHPDSFTRLRGNRHQTQVGTWEILVR